jgi:hypothetical protein
MQRNNWDRNNSGGGYQDYGGMTGGGQYGSESVGNYEWDYAGSGSSMRRGDMYQDDQYSGQFSGGQMYDGGRSAYGGQYDMDHDVGGYNSANLQATMMQMITSMQQAANSMPMGRGGSGLIPDPQA